MMERVPEPELMDDVEHAAAYSEADFDAAHGALVDRLLALHPPSGPMRVLDLGCGPGDVTVRVARAYPEARITGVDGSAPMVGLAGRRAEEHGVETRVAFRVGMIDEVEADPSGGYDLVVCTSVLHHLREPALLWHTIRRTGRIGGFVFVADLRRPASREEAEGIVARESEGEPEPLRRDFLNSLLAAYTPAEVRRQLGESGLGSLAAEPFGDRHLVTHGILSAPAG